MKNFMLLLLSLIVACGNQQHDDPPCRSVDQMRRSCFTDNAPIYGSRYASEMCTATYTIQKCY